MNSLGMGGGCALLCAAAVMLGAGVTMAWPSRQRGAVGDPEAERLRAMLEALRDGVALVDDAGVVTFANAALGIGLRRRLESPVGRHLVDALAPEFASVTARVFDEVHREGLDEQIRGSGVRFHGSIFDVAAMRVKSARTGRDFGTLFLLVDSSSGHELLQLKDRLLSGISHELRTPLTNICAYSEILCHIAPGESVEWQEFARIVHDEALQLANLVDCVFDFSQLESGGLDLNVEVLDGAAVCSMSIDRARERAAARGTELLFQVEGSVPQVRADARRFRQVCEQLVDNALKFTPRDGRIQVTVSEQGGDFRMVVEDSGPGVPQPERRAVFDTFVQLPDPMTEKPTGPGLGLATAQAVVSRLGGMIWCEESVLGGAAFVVRLPAAESAARLPDLPAKS